MSLFTAIPFFPALLRRPPPSRFLFCLFLTAIIERSSIVEADAAGCFLRFPLSSCPFSFFMSSTFPPPHRLFSAILRRDCGPCESFPSSFWSPFIFPPALTGYGLRNNGESHLSAGTIFFLEIALNSRVFYFFFYSLLSPCRLPFDRSPNSFHGAMCREYGPFPSASAGWLK